MENCRKSCETNITLQIFIDSPWKRNLFERENYKQPLNDWNLNGYCRSNDAAIFLATYLSSKNEDKNKRDHYAINSVTGDWRLTEKKYMLYCFLFLYNLSCIIVMLLVRMILKDCFETMPHSMRKRNVQASPNDLFRGCHQLLVFASTNWNEILLDLVMTSYIQNKLQF